MMGKLQILMCKIDHIFLLCMLRNAGSQVFTIILSLVSFRFSHCWPLSHLWNVFSMPLCSPSHLNPKERNFL